MSATAVSRTRSTDKRFYGVVEGVVTDVNDKDGKEGKNEGAEGKGKDSGDKNQSKGKDAVKIIDGADPELA